MFVYVCLLVYVFRFIFEEKKKKEVIKTLLQYRRRSLNKAEKKRSEYKKSEQKHRSFIVNNENRFDIKQRAQKRMSKLNLETRVKKKERTSEKRIK